MEKKIINEPIFETVQTGVNEKEVWVTSDGQQFDNENSAEYHKYYNCNLNERSFDIPYRVIIYDFHCKEDLERYEKDHTSDISYYKYDKNILTFPNTYVLYEVDESEDSDEWSYPEWSLYCVTLEEYKQYVNAKMNEIKAL
jgi:hypothetical protein